MRNADEGGALRHKEAPLKNALNQTRGIFPPVSLPLFFVFFHRDPELWAHRLAQLELNAPIKAEAQAYHGVPLGVCTGAAGAAFTAPDGYTREKLYHEAHTQMMMTISIASALLPLLLEKILPRFFTFNC